ncbi:hypothetical protein FHS19_000514 [Paenibacillus rhizosphaerae]|uniref:Uncharacterized protein n=1 Tax=Paenibacillus rhizosphaerae TaxID=297318 RepID=A0A839TJD1_9BACL|nr:hypothetical protein [Paenibacillus rhizosphaerae]MBB3125860.1 hypothetical protein [Paenibacillus rhizosphaerae]
MNIGSLLRGMMGDTKAGETKQLDLKEGQVVRGVVLSVSEDGREAVLQIQGVKVRAALETPLQPGQAAVLQVQPDNGGGLPVLKSMEGSPYGAGTPLTLADVLQSLDLPDTPENRAMLEALRISGVYVTKENAAVFKDALALKPAGVSTEQWLGAAAIANQRGLPLTGESVRGLQQAVFGPPVHQLLQVLEEQLNAFTAQAAAGSEEAGAAVKSGQGVMAPQAPGPPPPSLLPGAGVQPGFGSTAAPESEPTAGARTPRSTEAEGNAGKAAGRAADGSSAAGTAAAASHPAAALQPLVARLQALLQQLRAAPLTGAAASTPAPAGGFAAPAAEPAPQHAAQGGEGPAGTGPSPKTPQSHGAEPWVGRLLKLLGAEHEQQGVRAALLQPAQEAPQGPGAAAGNARQAMAAPAAGQGAAAEAGPAQPGPAAGAASAAGAAAAQPAPQAADGPELTVRAHAVQQQPPGPAHHTVRPEQPAEPAARMEQALQETGQRDTLKGLLLQLVQDDAALPALKEAAQQVISQLTGQQLLLNTDRTAPFAQVTLFLPLNGPDGQETASVHVQSRRGPKGELDASNCRLWFDLQMKHLGQTLIDVQIVDRIVSLKVHNDQEWAQSLVEDRRSEIVDALSTLGYQLLTLKAGPLPSPGVEPPSGLSAAMGGHRMADYVPQSYKGVDMRV